MPFLNICHPLIDLILYKWNLLRPHYVAMVSTLFTIGWITQWAIWVDCELSDASEGSSMCLKQSFTFLEVTLQGQYQVLAQTRIAFGVITTVLYSSAACLAVIAIRLSKAGRHTTKERELSAFDCLPDREGIPHYNANSYGPNEEPAEVPDTSRLQTYGPKGLNELPSFSRPYAIRGNLNEALGSSRVHEAENESPSSPSSQAPPRYEALASTVYEAPDSAMQKAPDSAVYEAPG